MPNQIVANAVLQAKAILGPKERATAEAVCSDMGRLLPGFREQVEALVADMRGAGFDPRVYETWRSPERVAMLVAKGVGSKNSVHPYGIAADIIDAKLLWNAKAAFWTNLTTFAEARGLTSGARFSKLHDLPHVQGIPVSAQAGLVSKGNGLLLGEDILIDADRDGYAKQFYKLPRQAIA
jgi:hypothetical protein